MPIQGTWMWTSSLRNTRNREDYRPIFLLASRGRILYPRGEVNGLEPVDFYELSRSFRRASMHSFLHSSPLHAYTCTHFQVLLSLIRGRRLGGLRLVHHRLPDLRRDRGNALHKERRQRTKVVSCLVQVCFVGSSCYPPLPFQQHGINSNILFSFGHRARASYAWALKTPSRCVCVCVCFLPIHSGHQVRWTYQPGSHRRKVTQDF